MRSLRVSVGPYESRSVGCLLATCWLQVQREHCLAVAKVPLENTFQYDVGTPDGRSRLENASMRSGFGGTAARLGRSVVTGVPMWTESKRRESHETHARDSAVTGAVASSYNGQRDIKC